ncbi:hypothetical protein A1F94_002900 [Pyrenophora tritici-repentis]|nr:hypothetical protein A1F94_002900 [Pyrenophora tritici-repentis]
MPAKRTRVNALEIATTSKRPRVAARHRGTASQPVLVDTRPFSPSPPPPPLDLRESRAEETIIPPPEGSEHATVAASGAASEAVDEGFVWVEDKYDGFNWSRYPKHCKPPTSLSNRASWVYSHGYRIALRSNVAKSRGSATIAISTSSLLKRTTVAPRKETLLERALQKGCSQAVANELTNFNIQEFRLAAVTWLVENNLPLSQFESSSFRNMIQLASVEAERALWASHNSVSRYVIRLYNYLLPKVVASLSESMSKVHISFDGWTTKGGKRGYLGIVAHYVDSSGELRDFALEVRFPQQQNRSVEHNISHSRDDDDDKVTMAPSTAMDAIPKLQADGSNAYHWEAALKLYANIHSIGGLLDGSYMVTYPETPHYQTEPTTTSSAFNTPQLLLDAQQRVRAHNKEVTTQYDKDYELYRIYNSRESSLTLAILNTVPRSVWDNVMNLPTVRQKYEAITARYREQGVTEECTIWADFFKLRAQDCPSTANFTDKFKTGLAKLDVIADCKLSNKARVYQFILAINNAYPDYGRDRRADLRRNVTLNVDRMCSELIDEARRDDPIKTINTSIRASGGDNNRKAPPVAAAIEAMGEPSADEVEVLRVRLRDLQIPPHTASTATATILEERQAQQQGKQQPTSTNAAAINAEGFAFTTVHLSEKVQSLTKETSNFKQRFIIDTGSSDHICNDRSKFQILHDTAPATINTGAGPITAKQVGTIQITVVTSEGVLNKVSFTNVLYAPDMFVSVLSHSKLRAKNLYYHGWDSKLYLMPSQQEIAFTPEVDKIPTLLLANTELEAARAFALQPPRPPTQQVYSPYREITLQELHELFGHADPKALKLLVANTTGLRLTTTQAFSCEACMLSKSKKQISRRSPARSTTFLHRIHIDIVGPVTPEGVNGERYWILYTDDYSRYRWIDFTDCKAAITSKLIQHLDKMETQHHTYWPYAAQYSIDVLNHSVSSAVPDSKTPRQLLFEHMKVANPVPNLCSFRTFGEAGYVHQPVQRRVQSAKFEPRSVKMYFVGREGSRIYLMWDPVTQSIHQTEAQSTFDFDADIDNYNSLTEVANARATPQRRDTSQNAPRHDEISASFDARNILDGRRRITRPPNRYAAVSLLCYGNYRGNNNRLTA